MSSPPKAMGRPAHEPRRPLPGSRAGRLGGRPPARRRSHRRRIARPHRRWARGRDAPRKRRRSAARLATGRSHHRHQSPAGHRARCRRRRDAARRVACGRGDDALRHPPPLRRRAAFRLAATGRTASICHARHRPAAPSRGSGRRGPALPLPHRGHSRAGLRAAPATDLCGRRRVAGRVDRLFARHRRTRLRHPGLRRGGHRPRRAEPCRRPAAACGPAGRDGRRRPQPLRPLASERLVLPARAARPLFRGQPARPRPRVDARRRPVGRAADLQPHAQLVARRAALQRLGVGPRRRGRARHPLPSRSRLPARLHGRAPRIDRHRPRRPLGLRRLRRSGPLRSTCRPGLQPRCLRSGRNGRH